MSYFIRLDIYNLVSQSLEQNTLPPANTLPSINLATLAQKLGDYFPQHPLWQQLEFTPEIPRHYVIVEEYTYVQIIFKEIGKLQQSFVSDYYNPYQAQQHLPSVYKLGSKINLVLKTWKKTLNYLKQLYQKSSRPLELSELIVTLGQQKEQSFLSSPTNFEPAWWQEHQKLLKNLVLNYILKNRGSYCFLPLIINQPEIYIPIQLNTKNENNPTLEIFYDQTQGNCLKSYAWYNLSKQKLTNTEDNQHTSTQAYTFNLGQLIFFEQHPESKIYEKLGYTLANLHSLGISLEQGNNLHSWIYSLQKDQWTLLDLSTAKLYVKLPQNVIDRDIENLLDQINITNQVHMGYFFYEDWQAIAKGYEDPSI
ncbi:hypothetical protein [Psittacicella gerlachiana]|uniref:Uncharacterized protein n=1 Tax=Psittacicella gerlachiana TaxID=2028574 RepID=A0A3A1YQ49_9GAMM|nr:hypothetical protein [Psittacicella gerlachiana]RIY38464.1 hypothetical protein CKF59_00845 [Psittacicella gerlachiana]